MVLSDPWARSDPSSMVLLGGEIIGCVVPQRNSTSETNVL
jgi:hypothetical protein